MVAVKTKKTTDKKETRGALTRDRIIQEAVQIFSVKGFYNTSLEDILQATGLTKGGFFCHFKSKEELGFAAIDRAVQMWREKVWPLVRSQESPLDKLLAMIDGQCLMAESRTFKGGCFFLTWATEMDDQHELFRKRLEEVFDSWRDLIINIVEDGKKEGIFKKSIRPEEIANLIIADIEGTTLLSKVKRSGRLFAESMQSLKRVVESLVL